MKTVAVDDGGRVTVDGEALPGHLTGKEQDLLVAIMRQERVASKEHLMQVLYRGMDEPEIKIVDVLVCKLRKKLGPYAKAVQTVWGRGYLRHAEYVLARTWSSVAVSDDVRQRLDWLALAVNRRPDELGEELLANAIKLEETRVWA